MLGTRRAQSEVYLRWGRQDATLAYQNKNDLAATVAGMDSPNDSFATFAI